MSIDSATFGSPLSRRAPWLAALAAKFPTARHRTVRPRLLAAAILMIGSARRLCHLAVEGFPELALGLTL